MLVLGWHGSLARQGERPPIGPVRHGYAGHDGAAVLMRDGRIVAAIEEERLNRVKHSNFFPELAIRHCLAIGGATLDQVDVIVTDLAEKYLDLAALQLAMTDPAASLSGARADLATLFDASFGADVTSKLTFCRHHTAHLTAAWYGSGFDHGMALCIDGEGDGLSGIVADCHGDAIKVLRHLGIEQSLGYFYLGIIKFMGYKIFDEYKVMGLAPYGNPGVFETLFERLYRLEPEGRFWLASEEERIAHLREAGFGKGMRRKGEEFGPRDRDLAAALQVALERIVLHVLSYFRERTDASNLCLSGGVAHNCSMNGVIARSGLFDKFYVQPAAHDAGNALGAALWASRQAGLPIGRETLRHLYWGSAPGSAAEIGERLRQWAPLISARHVADAPSAAAALIADGKVIAWVQGRSEFGPRALGNRSILADPRPAENKRIINEMVKKREGYRPFAPSVLEERAGEFFGFPPGIDRAPFMILVLPVAEDKRALLGAVTHIDGTARVQTVSREDNPRYHALIEAFGRLTGVPVLLNTSFNNNAEPIVESVDDAVACFLTTGIEAMVIEDWLIEKASLADPLPLIELAPVLPASRRLGCSRSADGLLHCTIDSNANGFFAEPEIAISPLLYALLAEDAEADRPSGPRSFAARHACPRAVDERRELAREILDLWSRRAIALLPAAEEALAEEAAARRPASMVPAD